LGIQPVKSWALRLLVVMIGLELWRSVYSSGCHHHLNHP